jgi:2'-5' RNA ligase
MFFYRKFFLFCVGVLMMGSFEAMGSQNNELFLSAVDSPTGHPVYKGECGVVLLANRSVSDVSSRIQKEYFPETPPLHPHITLIQGKFSQEQKEELIDIIAGEARSTLSTSIQMAGTIVKGGGGNTFWDVDRNSVGWGFCNDLNGKLCDKVPHPVGLMQQVKDDVDADPELVEKWGRDFNVPGDNRPHITVVYGKQDEDLYRKIQEDIFEGQIFEFTPTGLALVRIDYLGNIVEIIEQFSFAD